MATILTELPYSFVNNSVASTSWQYSWTSGYSTLYNTCTTATNTTIRVDSVEKNPDGTFAVGYYIYVYTSLSRSGSDPGAFNYSSTPNFSFTSLGAGGTYTLYNANLTRNSLAYNASSSITHSQTNSINVPSTYGDVDNMIWRFTKSFTAYETTTGKNVTYSGYIDLDFEEILGGKNFLPLFISMNF